MRLVIRAIRSEKIIFEFRARCNAVIKAITRDDSSGTDENPGIYISARRRRRNLPRTYFLEPEPLKRRWHSVARARANVRRSLASTRHEIIYTVFNQRGR